MQTMSNQRAPWDGLIFLSHYSVAPRFFVWLRSDRISAAQRTPIYRLYRQFYTLPLNHERKIIVPLCRHFSLSSVVRSTHFAGTGRSSSAYPKGMEAKCVVIIEFIVAVASRFRRWQVIVFATVQFAGYANKLVASRQVWLSSAGKGARRQKWQPCVQSFSCIYFVLKQINFL